MGFMLLLIPSCAIVFAVCRSREVAVTNLTKPCILPSLCCSFDHHRVTFTDRLVKTDKGLDEIQRLIESNKFDWRTDREVVHMNIEAALTDLVGEPAKKLHDVGSSNDQVLTDFRLWCRDAIDKTVDSIKGLVCVQALSAPGPSP